MLRIVFNSMVGGSKLLLIRAGDVPKLVGREEKKENHRTERLSRL